VRRVGAGEACGGVDLLELAQVVRDGMRRDSQAKEGAVPKVSEGERRLYLQARQPLSGEIGSARGLDEVEAEAWSEEQLALA
jgi:RNA polymerase-interacting CarD/CdnL/TRCF family regulator